MIEMIGNVQLNSNQIESDLYDAEQDKVDHLIRIFEQNEKTDLNTVICENQDYFYLKNLFYGREAILSAMDIDRNKSVLEIGAGCGALTGRLCETAGDVVCVDRSSLRSRVNALRHQSCENLELYAGKYKDINVELKKKFDVILLVGIMEENDVYGNSEMSLSAFIMTFSDYLTEGGCMYLAVDNRMGMHYLSGGKRMTDMKYFEAFDEDMHARYTKSELDTIVKDSGFYIDRWIYPYPNYIFPNSFYTDKRMPRPGELAEQVPDFENNHLYLFQENKLADMLIKEKIYDRFATSFLVQIRKAD